MSLADRRKRIEERSSGSGRRESIDSFVSYRNSRFDEEDREERISRGDLTQEERKGDGVSSPLSDKDKRALNAVERFSRSFGNTLESATPRDPLKSSARFLYTDAALKKNEKTIDELGGAGSTAAMRATLAANEAYDRRRDWTNRKIIDEFGSREGYRDYLSRGKVNSITGTTRAERREQKQALEAELDDINKYLKSRQYGTTPLDDDRALYDPTYEGYLNNEDLTAEAGGGRYYDAQGRDTGRTYEERKEEIEKALAAYGVYDRASDLLITGVENTDSGARRSGWISTAEGNKQITPEELDAYYEITPEDVGKYYKDSAYVRWLVATGQAEAPETVERDRDDEAALINSEEFAFEMLDDEEKRALNFVLHSEGTRSANRALKDMAADLSRRNVEYKTNKFREGSEKLWAGPAGDALEAVFDISTGIASPATAIAGKIIKKATGYETDKEARGRIINDAIEPIISMGASLATTPISFLDSLNQRIPDEEGIARVNPYSTYQAPRRWAQESRQRTAEDIDALTGNRKLLGLGLGDVYQAAMSSAESIAGAYTMGPAYSVIMGMGAATDEMNRLAEEGANNGEQVVGGLLAGAAETVFEHVSLERFANKFINGNPATWRAYIKDVLIQAGVEGSEELVTEIANTLSNKAVMGTQSDWDKAAREYIDAGMSKEDAYRKVWVDKALELWKVTAEGALSGGMMGGAGAASVVQNKMADAAELNEIGADITGANKGRALSKQALDIAASGNVDAKTAKALEKAAEAYDKKNDNKRAGKLFRAVTDAVNEGITNEEAQETAAEKVAAVLLGNGVDYVRASDPVSGDAVTVDRAAPIARTEDGSVYMNTDRGEVALEDLAFEDDAVRDMIYSVSEYGPEYANMVLTNYGGEDVGSYLGGMREGILTGQYGDLGEELYDFNSLSRADQNLALKIGQSIRADQVAAKAEAAKAARLSELNVRGRDLTKQDMKIEGVRAGRGASGRVGQLYFDQGVKVESDLDRANADFAKLVSLVYGNDIVVFDSEQNPELKNKNGMHVGSDGSIWVDIRAGEARQGLVAYALSHEMTHEAAQWAPEAYRAFTDFLVKNYAEQGVSVRQLVSKKMADMGTDNFDAAFDEVIADACERFLLDSNAIQKLNEMRKTDRTTFEKIRDFIKSAIAKLKAALQSLKTAGRLEGTEASEAFRNSATGEQIEELEKKIKQLEDAWSMVLVEAAANRAKASGETAAAENVQNSERTGRLTKDDYARYMELAKDPEANEAELSRMVEAAAREAGYDSPKLYHGTREFGFTKFDLHKGDNVIFATSDINIAKTYVGETERRNISDKSTYEDASTLSPDELLAEAEKYFGDKYKGLMLLSEDDKRVKADIARENLQKIKSEVARWFQDNEGDFNEEKKKLADGILSAIDDMSKATDDNIEETWSRYNAATWELRYADVSFGEEYTKEFDKRISGQFSLLDDFLYKGNIFGYWAGMGENYIFDNQMIVDLNELHGKGVYELYGKLGRSYDVDSKRSSWKDIKHWAPVYTKQNTVVTENDDSYILLDKVTGNEVTRISKTGTWGNKIDGKTAENVLLTKAAGLTALMNDRGNVKTRDLASYAFNSGYDSVVIRNLYDLGGRTNYDEPGDIYIFNAKNAVKSADPVTYDSEGNIIPLSERFNEERDDIRYSTRTGAAENARYLELAKDPEKNEAELSRMVEAAAREAGYDSPKLYHGTRTFGFTRFGNTIFATSAPWIAETYARGLRTENYKSSLKNAVNYTDALKLSSEELLKAAKDSLGWKYWGLEIANAKDAAEDTVYKYHTGRDFFIKGSELAKELNDTVFNGVYQLFGKLGRSLTINAQGRYFDEIKIGNKTTSTDKIVESAFKSGYDSVIIKNVFDAKGEKTRSGDVYAFRNNSDVKSAEPVVYDDNGNVIPLSERFKEERDDIRYSTRTGTSTSTRAVVERALETLKDGPEKTALTAYKRVLDQIDETIAEYSEARKNRDAAAAAEAKKQLNTLQAKARKMETAPAMQNVAAMQDVAALNEDVRNLSRLLKLQSTETGGAIAMKSSLERAASDLMKGHGVKRGKAELVELLNNFYTDMTREVRAETLNREYMVAAAQPIAEWLVDNAPNQTEIDTEINDVLKYIKGSKIRVNDQQRGDIENKYESFEKWRKSLFPYVTVTTDPSATTLDSFWADLAAQYPDYFDANLSWADQGVELSGVLSNLKSGRVTEYYLSPEARSWLVEAAANDVAEAFWKIKPYETVADKYAKEIRRLKEDHKAYRNIDEYIQDQKQAAYDLGYSRAKLQQVRSEYRRRIRSLTENMSNRLIKPKVNKYIPESLQAATAEVLKAINLDSGRSKSFSEKLGQLREQYQKIIDREKAAQGIKEDQDGRFPITTEDQVVEDTLKLVEERVKNVPISEMSSVQLEAVYTALKMFDHVVRDRVNAESMNTLLDEKMTVQDIGERLIEESEETKERRGAISRYFNWQMRPEEFFETLAGYKKNSMWHRVYQMLDNAQRQQIFYEMQGNEIFRDVLKDQKYVRSLSAHKDGDLVDIGLKDAKENPYKITRGMMLSIWKHLQNEENMRHIMIGGLVGPDLKKYYDGKTENVYNEKENRIFGVIGAELASAYKRIETKISDLDDKWEAAKIRGDGETMDAVAAERDAAWAERDDIVERGRAIMDQIRKNIEALLTEQDRAFLAASDKFFDEFSRGILNDATRRMYGFEKAKVENYFPIHVSSAFLGANFESIKRDFSVEGSGFMKDRVQSSKPIMLEDFGAVIDRQISNVAKYAALAPALKDFSKIYSVIRGGAEFETSVGKTISERFGDQGVEYLENLIADLNGARSREASPFDRLRSRGAGAVLTLNPRVSMVQAASYVTAASELGYGPLARALLNPEGHAVIGKRAPTELIKKYSGMLWTRKEKGNIDAAVAATRSLGNKRTLAESKLKFLTGWIEAVDAGTVGRLWYASEYYVQKKNPDMKGYKTSGDQKKIDQYYMKVADVFSNVIERTQPNYTVMQRPAVLRSTNAMTKALTMFMTQRLQNANILYSATRRWAKYSADYKAGINGVTREDVKEARSAFVNSVTSQMISAATISVMRLVADMLLRNMKGRRDEDDEITGESIGWSLLNDFLSSAMSNFLGGSEAYEAIRTALSGGKYYGISAGGLDQVNDFVSDTVNVLKSVAKGEFKPKELTSIGTDIGTLFGIPAGNAYKILKAIKGWGEAFGNETKAKGNLFDYGTGEIWESGPMERTKKQKGNLMLKAYQEGNKERYREIQGQFADRGKADEALLDTVYEEWAAGEMSDGDALKILEDCLSSDKAPDTENKKRIQIEKWENKKANADLPEEERTSYGVYNDLKNALRAYVFPEAGADRVTAGRKAQAMIEQYRVWGYDDTQIRDAIRNTFKGEYVAMAEGKDKDAARDYIAKLYTFTKDSKGKDYKDKDAKKLIDKWKATEEETEEETEDEREWG